MTRSVGHANARPQAMRSAPPATTRPTYPDEPESAGGMLGVEKCGLEHLRCRRAPQLRNRRSVVPAPASRACTVPRPSSSRPTFRRRAFSTGERGPRRRRARSGLPPGPHGSDQRPAPSAERCSSATRRYGQLSPTPQTPQGPNARGRHRTHEVAINRKPGHELLVAAVRFSGDSGGGPATLQRRRRLRSS